MFEHLAPRLLSALLAACAIGLPTAAQAQDATREAAPLRPRVALVLSGGGARGLAHIGVLRELEAMRVPVDLVVGTSMGAVVGGAFAAGRRVDELESFVRQANWDSILADRPPRRDLAFRRREEDLVVPSRIELGLGRQGIALPPAAAGNSSLEFTLERLVAEGRGDWPVNQLALPFRALATDLATGDLKQLTDTPLFLAMRASLAVPGVFAPVRVDGRLVVDGGLVRNLGVDVAREMGAQIIIAVNVGTPLMEEKEITSAVGVANQMLQILTEQNVKRSVAELKAQDLLIAPRLGEVGFIDFKRFDAAIAAGREATRAMAPRLQALALSAEAYAEQELARQITPVAMARALPLASLNVQGTRHAAPDLVRGETRLELGQPVTLAEVNKAAANLYGSGDFDRVETQVSDRDGKRHVNLNLTEAQWGRSRIRLGLELYSNFGESNRFTLVAMHVASLLNDWGGELRSVARLGNQRGFSSSFLQPLGPGSDWYLSPSFSYEDSGFDAFEQGRITSRWGARERSVSLALGRRLGQWGDLQVGVGRALSSARQLLPEVADQSDAQVSVAAYYAQWRVDTLDTVTFPSRGNLIDARLERLRLPEGHSHHRLQFLGLSAFSWGSWAGHVYTEWAHSQLGSTGSLGGFLRLSGLPDNSLSGSSIGFGRFVMAKRLGEMPVGLGGAIRAGFSLEAGAGRERSQALGRADLRLATSVFLSVDTRFGPLYLAVGSARSSGNVISNAAYLYLGPFW
ncbi:MAG: patatin-like phospholipase family protein [Burkholderiaceae bacterium]|nr:patatin-like phospholipase family protein [Burkholderiaceae bacterium]